MTRLRSLIKEVLSQESPYYIIQSLKTGSPKYIASVKGEKPSWVPDNRIKQAHKFATLEDAKNYLSKFDTKRTAFWHIYKRPSGDVGLGPDLKESKKDCNCGCGGCGKKAPVLTESKTKTTISEGLQYHIDKKVPLHESVYRIGSEKHFALINEARALWVRELINVSEDDQAILETHLGNFGLYETVNFEGEEYDIISKDGDWVYLRSIHDTQVGRKEIKVKEKDITINEAEVPLDLPMVNEEVDDYYFQNAKEKLSNAYQILGKETGQTRKGDKFLQINYIPKSSPQTQNPEFVKVFYDNDEDLKGLDLPMVNEDIYDKFLDDPKNPKGRAKAIISKFIKQYGEDASGMAVDRFAKQNNLKPEEKYILKYITKNDISISSKPGGPDFSALSEAKTLKNNDKYLGYSASEQIYYVIDSKTGKEVKHTENAMAQLYGSDWKEQIDEAKKKAKSKKKDPPLNKPKRGGSKAYYVYVRDPKTKKIKKVSFGSGGLRAKIKNKEARNAFAARHNCKNKKDRTKAGYWSCNLPRYAEQLGLGSKMNTFW